MHGCKSGGSKALFSERFRVQNSKFGFVPALIRIVSTYWNGTMKCLTMKKYDTLITYWILLLKIKIAEIFLIYAAAVYNIDVK